MGFGGGGYSAPPVPTQTPEKPQVAKPVTEAATAARQAQKDKATKASGIGGSILTSPLQTKQEHTLAGANNYLGQ